MRLAVTVLLLSVAATAQPPAVKDFRRLRSLRDEIAAQVAQLKEAEEYALKPPEEKMLIAFDKGDKKFENDVLTGKLFVTAILVKWEAVQVQQEDLGEAGKRVLDRLPDVLFKRYAKAIEIPKDRKDVSKILCDALDSEYFPIRHAAFESLKRIYNTPSGYLYVPTMSKKDRQEPIRNWKKFVAKQK